MEQGTGTIVWLRRDDDAAQRKRVQRFWSYYATTPAALLVVVVALEGVLPGLRRSVAPLRDVN